MGAAGWFFFGGVIFWGFEFWGEALTILFYLASCINIYYNLVIPYEEYWLRKYYFGFTGICWVFFLNKQSKLN